ncbi:glutamate--tRNA ligase [Ehrlichia ruminantium]|uniref:Glutamate--tRNA ligase n=1 Tax=Ehrlichia ruminantium TaxID=779 RepID=A0AAE6QAK4_EHRRU|nr:glutamate--tRNA ligase [Ehrlichia ruminantium]QGR02830.1 glutamate--tRNA ligase [Ehrlichia ruminantium]QGR03754.1 glutamate--tRNA ligase [Ehrlichia ruminantium]QGR04681.1 glutamate--tRNA ligase [Ehrlichia ruminantium]
MMTRFAPSPTGYLHVGNVRTALICWLYTRSKKGKLLLRFDDTDLQRSSDEYKSEIANDLKWLHIDWDSEIKQSSRFDRYDEVFDYLLKEELVYPCYESKEELDFKRKMQLKLGLPPIYDRSALRLTQEEKNQYFGQAVYFRFKIDQNRLISWYDEVRGNVSFNPENISDPIVKRADGTYTYMLPSVIDDIDFNITHIIRGEDHISNTAVQIQMFHALKASIPVFSHLSLLYCNDSKISKRVGGFSVKDLQSYELEPMAINSYFAKIGTSDPIIVHTKMQDLIDAFDITKFSQAPTQFNIDDIVKLNPKVLHKMSFSDVESRLRDLNVTSPDLWYFISGNVEKFSDVKKWMEICSQNIVPVINKSDKDFIKMALSVFPEGEINHDTWKMWITNIKRETDRKPKDIFLPLRLVLTGLSTGPELAKLLPLLGKTEIVRRLSYSDIC